MRPPLRQRFKQRPTPRRRPLWSRVRREVKYNLIFLVALLALSAPGIYKLTSKALRGEGGLNSQPPDVAVRTPYLNPVGTASGVVRSVPPITLGWVDDVARATRHRPALRREAAGGRQEPILGTQFSAELIDFDGFHVGVLLWLHRDEPVQIWAVQAMAGDEKLKRLDAQVMPVPDDVVKELQAYGFPAPPTQVVVATFYPSQSLSIAGGTDVTVRWKQADQELQDTLRLPEPRTEIDE